ncbi:hypothetical protein HYU40_03385 [Candidatus Woesearchaeota archaeon]|nr:hypothetical protein [Candidatus Woesearchaeota archaeon]
MATILDLGLLKGFVDIFVWILVFLIVYGILEVTNIFKNKGLHALFAFTITAVIVLTGGGTNIITAMAPWVVVLAALIFFIFVLANFAGADMNDLPSIFGKKAVIWIVAIPLVIILIISWTQTPQQKTVVDAETGQVIVVETAQQQPRGYIAVLTDPKILGLVLILAIGSMTIALMASGGGAVGGH